MIVGSRCFYVIIIESISRCKKYSVFFLLIRHQIQIQIQMFTFTFFLQTNPLVEIESSELKAKE